MIRLTFKNVGQGDCILIEWTDADGNQIGILDCNKTEANNAALEYLIEKKYTNIKFIILSHPHYDHYSGVKEILDYYISNSLTINYFLHTCNNMPAFWRSAVNNVKNESALLQLLETIPLARARINLKDCAIQGDSPNDLISFSNGIRIQLIGPISMHLDKYASNYNDSYTEEEAGNNPSANWLSTFIKIYKDDWYILLTSDTQKDAIKYFDLHRGASLQGNLILAQCPHHGSKHNHTNDFWKKRKRKEKTPIVFSVGKNRYGHPSSDVIKSFEKNDYIVYSTNKVGGLLNQNSETEKDSQLLDLFSTYIYPVINDKLNGDKIFNIDLGGNII